MGCCGGRGRGATRSGGGNPHPVTVNAPGDTVILEYQGTKAGTMSRRGPVTKKWYTFSASPVNRRFECAKADAGHLMRMGDLVLVPQEQPPPPQPPPTPQAVQTVPLPAPVPQVRAVEQPTTKAPVAMQEEPPADDLSEIAGVTVDTAGILALVGIRTFQDLSTLTEDGVQRMMQLTGKGEGHVRKWIEEAKAKLEPDEEEDDAPGLGGGHLGDLGADLPDDV